MVKKLYIPERGDVVWLSFDPTKGHEQRGERPALVISPAKYNEKSSLALLVPITSQAKGYPFEIAIKAKKLSGVVLSDQIRSVDWRARSARYHASVSEEIVNQVIEYVRLLV